ncbi:MAG: hypoxanthine-guanine phosphoribosyltransferase [Gammaproteobacteria bacterium]|nr:hypoxanthine-guanine phosphoribosyltransferase [Gammaproteobacteria bacterium]
MTQDNYEQLFEHSQHVLAEAECLYTKAEVERAVEKLAIELNTELKGTNPIVMAVMNGGLITCGELLPKLNFQLQCDYLHATRYGYETSGKTLKWIAKPTLSLKDRTVLLIDDMHDVGETLKQIIQYCQEQGAKVVYSCVLVHKEHDRKQSEPADFTGLIVPDRYIFGYGMDYKTMLRNAPGIYAVKGM